MNIGHSMTKGQCLYSRFKSKGSKCRNGLGPILLTVEGPGSDKLWLAEGQLAGGGQAAGRGQTTREGRRGLECGEWVGGCVQGAALQMQIQMALPPASQLAGTAENGGLSLSTWWVEGRGTSAAWWGLL